MMLRKIYYRIKYKRLPLLSPDILSDVRAYLDEQIVTEKTDLEATAELYDTSELSEAMSAESVSEENSIQYSCSEAGYDGIAGGGLSGDEDEAEAFVGEAFTARELRSESFKDACPSPKEGVQKASKRGLPLPSLKSSGKQDTAIHSDLNEVISRLGLTFQQTLLRMIDRKGYTDSQVYRKANLDRKLFSKIRCNKDYKPSKTTALSLAIALGLNYDEATDLLGRAGLAFSPSSTSDMIIKYCITHEIFDIYEVNAILYEYDQQLLGC